MSAVTSFHVDTADVGDPPSSSSAPTQDGNAKHHVGTEIDFNKRLLDAARDGNVVKLVGFLELQAEINTSNSDRETPLWLAVDHDVDSMIQVLIKRGADVNAKSCYGETPLYRAVNQKKMWAIQLLLDSKADVNAPKDGGDFPLYLAVSRENEDIVRLLLESGADVNKKGPKGITPLHRAVSKGNEDILQLLLERGADVNEKGPKGITPLYRAVSKGNEDILQLLLERGADVNEKGPKGITPLYRALYDGNEAILKLLLDWKADVNAQDNGKTPLERAFEIGNIEAMLLLLKHKATFLAPNSVKNLELSFHVYMGHKDVVEELLKNNADIEEVNHKNMTVLHWAAVAGFEELVKLLLERGAKATASDDKWMTPLHYASQEGHEAAAVLLLNNKANIEMKNDDGMTALHLAAIRGREKVAQLLLKENAYIESRSSSGWTPLHLAAEAGHTDVMEVLCSHKADIESKNQSEGGLTPLLLASGKDRPDAVTWLLRAGANVNARDNGGSTALHWAAYFCQANVAVVLLRRMSDKTVTAKDDNGNTALHFAASEKSREVAELLSQRMDEDTLTLKNAAGQTAFSIAADNGDKAVLQILVNHMADLTYKDGIQLEAGVRIKPEKINSVGEALLSNLQLWKDSETRLKTLYWAARNGHLPILSNMLESFPETLSDANLYTALYWAAFGGQEAAVDFLIKLSGNDTEAVLKNDDAEKALKVAARNGYNEIVGRLLRRMVNLNVYDKMKNWTLLHFVVIYGDIDIFRLILRSSTHSKAKRAVLEVANAVVAKINKESEIDGDNEQTRTAVDKILSFMDLVEKPLENPLRFPPKPSSLEKPKQLLSKLDKIYHLININITDFYAQDGLSPTVETQKSISEVIYGLGPERIMSRIINKWNIPSYQHRFRWIHLPANNWNWLEDLMQKISYESQKSDAEYFRLQNFVTENRRDREHLGLGKTHSRFMYSGLRYERQDFDAGSWARSLSSRPQHQAAKKEKQQKREDTTKDREQLKSERGNPAGIDEVSHLKGCKIAICIPFLTLGTVQCQKQMQKAIYLAEEIHKQTPKTSSPSEEGLVGIPDDERARRAKMKILAQGIDDVEALLWTIPNDNLNQDQKDLLKAIESTKDDFRATFRHENVESAKGGIVGPRAKQTNLQGTQEIVENGKDKLAGTLTTLDSLKSKSTVAATKSAKNPLSFFEPLERLQDAIEIFTEKDQISEDAQLLRHFAIYKYLDDLHVSRTLDQYYYPWLSDTRRRDGEQVVRRYQEHLLQAQQSPTNINEHSGKGTKKPGQPTRGERKSLMKYLRDLWGKDEANEFRISSDEQRLKSEGEIHVPEICMVDQLWLWIIDDRTIITCFPEAGSQRQELLATIRRHIQKEVRPPIYSVYHMAVLIMSICSNFIGESLLNTFANSIGIVADEEAKCFEKFKRKLSVRMTHQQKRGGSSSSKLELDLLEEIKLLQDIKEIKDELNILQNIFEDQKEALDNLFGLILRDGSTAKDKEIAKNPILNHYRERSKIDIRLERIHNMQGDASTTYEALNHLLDLKQKDANLLEASEARIRADEAARQGVTILVFTVVTIIFLPMSFLASLFALNVDSFPHDSGNLSYPSRWIFSMIFGTTAAIAVPLILIALYILKFLDILKNFWYLIKLPYYPSRHDSNQEPKKLISRPQIEKNYSVLSWKSRSRQEKLPLQDPV